MSTATKTKPAAKRAPKKAETVAPPAVDQTIEIGSGLLRKIAQTVAPFASSDSDRPLITGLHIHTEDGKLMVDASDSYTIGAITTASFEGGPFDAVVPARWLARWSKIEATKPWKAPTVKLTLSTDGLLTLADMALGESFTIKAIEGTFPGLRKLITDSTFPEATGEHEVAFNPALYRRCFDAAYRWGSASGRPLQLQGVGELKPWAAKVDGADGLLDLVLMPVRLPS